MRSRLFVTSFITLGLLFGMLVALFLMVLYYLHAYSPWLLFGLTIVFNIVIWLVNPKITDWVQRFFYKAVYFDQASFTEAYPEYAQFINDLCQKNKMPFPKIGFIGDYNPTAFSYGSGRWNARLVFTQGILSYLEPGEVKAVLGHELGHVVHRDFIVMSLANTIIQIFYEIFYVFARGGKGDRKGSQLVFVGWIAYVFYWIGIYIVLFLNRLREYYADEFSAQSTEQPHDLSKALVKVAYGIMVKDDNAKSQRLLESTKTMGIMSVQSAKGAGLAASVLNMDPAKVSKVMLYDIVSPWAKLAQISATHPLTGRRLLKMENMAKDLGQPVLYDVEAAEQSTTYDKGLLWRKFFMGVFMYFIPVLAILGSLVAAAVFYQDNSKAGIVAAITFVLIFGCYLLRIFYRYPATKNAPEGEVIDLMSDIYASPVRGRAVQMSGTIVGKGIPGYIFSEDMMMQDKSGLMYLDYQGAFGIFSNLVFALKKIKKFMGMDVAAKGWFFRSNTQFLQLKELQSGDKKVKSYPRMWSLIGAFILAGVLAGVLYLVASSSATTAATTANTTATFPAGVGRAQNACFSVEAPAGSLVTKSDACDMQINSPVSGTSAAEPYALNLIVSPQTDSSFSKQIDEWKSFSSVQIISENPITISGLAAERITYTDPGAPQYPLLIVFVNTSARLTAPAFTYYMEIQAPFDSQHDTQTVDSVINSLQVNDYELNQ